MKTKLIITSENDMYFLKKGVISSIREAIRIISRQVIRNSSILMNEKDYNDIMKWSSEK